MKSNILENSFINLLDAADRLNEPDPDLNSLKYAVEHLWRGIELLFKQRLVDEHWSLIYENISYSDPAEDPRRSGGFSLTSISFLDMEERLYAICGVDISGYLDILNKIRKDHHKIQHYRFAGSKAQIISNLVQIWPFIVDFTSKHLDFAYDVYAMNLFRQIGELMHLHKGFIRQRQDQTRKVLDHKLQEAYYAKPLKCPECRQTAIPLLSNDNARIKCAFCDHTSHWQELALACGADVDYAGPFDCLHCGAKGAVRTEDRWLCLSCCHGWDLENFNVCPSCGSRLVSALHDQSYCENCSI